MATNRSNRLNIVAADQTTVFDKIDLMRNLGYFGRTRWERATTVDVLNDDRMYLDLLSCDKEYCEFVRGTRIMGNTPLTGSTIESTIHTDSKNNRLAFVTVAHRGEITNDLTANQQYINSTRQNENFVFLSVFPNSSTTVETGRGGNQITTLEGIQLFRYDPTGRFNHHNLNDIYEYYENTYSDNTANFYKRFFTEEVEFPHFHFSNRLMAESYGRSAEANAISLDKLIEYIEELRANNNQKHVINNLDFGMPYLDIKKNPNKYKTSIDIRNLAQALVNNNVNKQINSIFKQTQKLEPTTKILRGLDAVYADLVLLRILRGGGSGMAQSPQSAPNPGGPQGGSGPNTGGIVGGSGSGAGRQGGSGDGLTTDASALMSFVRRRRAIANSYNDMINNREPRDFRDDDIPRYEVSTAELQLATKIATANNLTLMNSKGRKKMHFEEANPYVDNTSTLMLHKLFEICVSKNYMGDGYDGPIR